MKILVTGGAGFIGSHVTDVFVAAGHEVVLIDDLSTGKVENLNPQARFYQIDIRDLDGLRRVFENEKVDIVCHQAARASVQESLRHPILYAQVNILGSLNLLELCRQFGVRKFIYASTGGAVYGEPQYLPVDENHPTNPLDPYGASKHHVEHYLHLYSINFNLPFTILRYANVYGPRQDPFGEGGVVAIFTHRMLNGKQPIVNGSGDQERDFVYVGDVARANLFALTHSDNSMINLGTGHGTSVNTLFEKLQEATNFKGTCVYGPAKPGEVFRIWLDISKAQSELGWMPQVGLDEGLWRTVEFFRLKQQESCDSLRIRNGMPASN